MNKTALKNFAIAARLELLQRVMNRANIYGVNEETCKNHSIDRSSGFQKLGGELLTHEEEAQRDALIHRVNLQGYRQTMEEAAYTWFNRLIALRYMQEHRLLPVRERVLPEIPGQMPEIIREAHQLSMEGVDSALVLDLLDRNDTTTLYRYLLISLCNALHDPLPLMFEKLSDYTELLFPDGLLKADSVLGELAKLDGDCWREIQVIGWLYQYYITEINDIIYDGSMSKNRIPKELLPAATQIFTPNWVVKYMVENSLGRLWQEAHHDENLHMKWRYYIDEAQQEPALAERRKSLAALQPEQIRLLDPCMGSGHILVYAFDVLMDIYRSMGYTDRDAVQSIVENNLYGLDIDDRAAQLAYFAVMMKACEYDRRFLRRGVQPHVCSIQESRKMEDTVLNRFGAEKALAKRLLDTFWEAKEYGSILRFDLTEAEFDRLTRRTAELKTAEGTTLTDMADKASAAAAIEPLLEQARIMTQQYDVVITNPPYLGSARFSPALAEYVVSNYPEAKADLSAVMYLKSMKDYTKPNGFMSFITITSWMFLSSFEKFRQKVLATQSIINLVDFGSELFEGKVGHNLVAAWVARNQAVKATMTAVRLTNYNYARRDEKEKEYFEERNRYTAQQENFKKIPGMPVAYWCSTKFIDSFDNQKLGEKVELVEGIHTRDNERFLRLWHEIDITRSSLLTFSHSQKWFAYNKGGLFRQWYGNNDYVVNWENDGRSIKNFSKASIGACSHFFEDGITFTFLTSAVNSFRYSPKGYLYDMARPNIYPDNKTELWYLLGLFVSKLSPHFLNVINPTLNMPLGDVKKFPIIIDIGRAHIVDKTVCASVKISKSDWDSFETSWDFKKHPLI